MAQPYVVAMLVPAALMMPGMPSQAWTPLISSPN